MHCGEFWVTSGILRFPLDPRRAGKPTRFPFAPNRRILVFEDKTPLFGDDFGEEKRNLDFDREKYDRKDRGETDRKVFFWQNGMPLLGEETLACTQAGTTVLNGPAGAGLSIGRTNATSDA
eukprot:scaffold1146_cov339-Pavlova_lutheri.AAC.2